MNEETRDPYVLHARWFLKKLQRALESFRLSAEFVVGEELVQINGIWPQVLAAFSWTVSQSESSPHAADLALAFLACGTTDNLAELRRSTDDLHRWSRAAEASAIRFATEPEKAELLRKLAQSAVMQGEQLVVVHDTRAKLNTLLGEIIPVNSTIVQPSPGTRTTQSGESK